MTTRNALPTRSRLHAIFVVGLVFKAVDGILEIVGAVLLSLITSAQLAHWVHLLTQHDLDADADDRVAKFVIHAIQHRSASTQVFATVLLMGHGTVKLGLVFALVKKYRWAYPTAIAIFSAFLIYQLYRFSFTHAGWLVALSAIDSLVIALAGLEYRRLRQTADWMRPNP